MQLSGQESFHLPPRQVWPHLTDMQFMARVIPDLVGIESVDTTSLVCHVRPRFSFFSGKVKLTFEISEQQEPENLKIKVHGKGIGGAVVVEITIELAPAGEGSLVNWKGEVMQKEGLFRPISDTLISGAAGRVIDTLWEDFRSAIIQTPSSCVEE
jgi:carbon monoxide dehydrogenase subunit G